MPQYKNIQYGLKQYGLFQTRPGSGGGDGSGGAIRNWQFVQSRIGARLKDGTIYWVYQHTPIQVTGSHTKLKLQTNTGDVILIEETTIKGKVQSLRLSSSGLEPIYSTNYLMKGGATSGLSS